MLVMLQIKVLSITGQKVSLTMKDVCQDTGKDLNPTSHAHLEVSLFILFLAQHYLIYYSIQNAAIIL